MLSDTKIVIIGGGVMGGAIAAGLVSDGWQQVSVVEANPLRREQLDAHPGLRVVATASEVLADAEVVALVVKPKDVYALCDQIGTELPDDALVLSMCAGVSLAELGAHLPAQTPIIRVMPNTGAQVGEAMSALSPNAAATSAHQDLAVALLSAVGRAIVVPEQLQDAVTALSGSGPAYVFYLAEAMIEAGVQLGLSRDQSDQLVRQTIIGSAKLLATGDHPAVLRERVTSPGGTTAAAIRQLDAHAVRAAVSDAIWAAHDRSRGLA